jgi:xanthine dehydrogenase accessory factor
MSTSKRIYAFLSDRLSAAQACVLVTVTDVTGASVRNPGAQMAVSSQGDYVGSLSGGCIETAIVGEALEALRSEAPRRIAYGAGSPIIDIRLPCGGRVDLLFTPLTHSGVIAEVRGAMADRRCTTLVLPSSGNAVTLAPGGATGWTAGGEAFCVRLVPPLRLVIAGHGAAVEALAALAGAMDIDCEVLTPDQLIADRLGAHGLPVHVLETRGDTAAITGDPWTAFAFFFHDHDWEDALIGAALGGPSLYVGAMGSRKTHAARCDHLRALGTAQADLDRIVAPIGLIPSSRDPETLALSALAQIVDAYNSAKQAQEQTGTAM